MRSGRKKLRLANPRTARPSSLERRRSAIGMAATRRHVLGLAAVAAVAGARSGRAEDRRSPAADLAAFDKLWGLARDRFYAPALHGVDRPATRGRYRPQAEPAHSPAEGAGAINAMLAMTKAYHTPGRAGLLSGRRHFRRRARAARPRARLSGRRSALTGDRDFHRDRPTGPAVRGGRDRRRADAPRGPARGRGRRAGDSAPFDRRHAAGADPQLDRAVEALSS